MRLLKAIREATGRGYSVTFESDGNGDVLVSVRREYDDAWGAGSFCIEGDGEKWDRLAADYVMRCLENGYGVDAEPGVVEFAPLPRRTATTVSRAAAPATIGLADDAE